MLPVRGATLAAGFGGLLMSISIHAPRAGSDRPPHQQPPSVLYFNPCSPCGERLSVIQFLMPTIQFQSMLPVRGATKNQVAHDSVFRISIHAPRAGSDGQRARGRGTPSYFNPCSPCGERRWQAGTESMAIMDFNPCSPCGERLVPGCLGHRPSYFNPCSPCGERRMRPQRPPSRAYFNPCSPCGERHF